MLPGESIEEMNTEATAWRLLEPWGLHAGNAELERHTVYRFQARWAERWNDGRLLLAGADKCSINSAAVARPELVAEGARKFGSQCVVVAVDAKQSSPGKWEVFTHGGRRGTGIDVLDWCRQVVSLGAGEILLTSMDRDGTKAGFDLELTRAVSDAVSVPVIASGGVGNLDHLADGVQKGGADAVLAASIEMGGTTLRDFLRENGEPGYFKQTLRVYDRSGELCLACGTAVKRIVQGARSTFYCPSRQR